MPTPGGLATHHFGLNACSQSRWQSMRLLLLEGFLNPSRWWSDLAPPPADGLQAFRLGRGRTCPLREQSRDCPPTISCIHPYPYFGLTLRSPGIKNPWSEAGAPAGYRSWLPFPRLMRRYKSETTRGSEMEPSAKEDRPNRTSARCDPIAPGLEQRQQGGLGRIDAGGL